VKKGFEILVVVILLISLVTFTNAVTSKKPVNSQKSILAILQLNPKPGEQKFYEEVSVEFDRTVCQSFSLKTRPKELDRLSLIKFDGHTRFTWYHPVCKGWRPNTKYQVTLTSPDYFIYQDRPIKNLSWNFTSASKRVLDEVNNDIPFDPENPFCLVPFPIKKGNFIIDQSDKKHYQIYLSGSFKAIPDGELTPEQRKAYNIEIEKAKKDALRWLRDGGQDPAKVKIKWKYFKI
jgi:hypothetical protein